MLAANCPKSSVIVPSGTGYSGTESQAARAEISKAKRQNSLTHCGVRLSKKRVVRIGLLKMLVGYCFAGGSTVEVGGGGYVVGIVLVRLPLYRFDEVAEEWVRAGWAAL